MKQIQKTIYKNKNEKIEKVSFKEMPFLDYLSYSDDKIVFSKDLSNIRFIIMIDENKEENDIKQEDEINKMLELVNFFKKDYEKAKEKNDTSFISAFLEKRDKTTMFFKMFNNEDFSYKELYKFAKNSYQGIENAYGYKYLIDGMLACMTKDDEIKKEMERNISEKTQVNNNKIIAYRGFNSKNRRKGNSYTLEYETAEFFKNRWKNIPEKCYINKYEIDINNIAAFIDEGESEIIATKAKCIEKNI